MNLNACFTPMELKVSYSITIFQKRQCILQIMFDSSYVAMKYALHLLPPLLITFDHSSPDPIRDITKIASNS